MRRRQEHTGGGDGDAKRYDSEAGDDESEEMAVNGAKRKRNQKTKAHFSEKVLDDFERSEVFKLIDAV